MTAVDQLTLHYQPRILLQNGQCHGAEALLRWNYLEFGSISPAEFIPLGEPDGAYRVGEPDGAYRAADRMGDAPRYNAEPPLPGCGAQFARLHQCVTGQFVRRRLRRCAAASLRCDRPGASSELEFTEGTFATNSARTVQQLGRLRAAGIDVALDDFGSGYFNLSYLALIPPMSSRSTNLSSGRSRSMATTIFLFRHVISIAQGRGFRVCAEGIETAHAYAYLRKLGCDEGQGYYMAQTHAGRAAVIVVRRPTQIANGFHHRPQHRHSRSAVVRGTSR